MKNIANEILLGGGISGLEIGSLDRISTALGIDKFLNDGEEEEDKESSKSEKGEIINEDRNEDNQKEVSEKDLNLKIMCIQNGEKIYKFSDLYIPLNQIKKKKIEKYMEKKLKAPDKEKEKEKEEDSKKKEKNDVKEVEYLMKRIKRSQKGVKMNVIYDEKFFDKTEFFEKKQNQIIYENETQKIKNENKLDDNKLIGIFGDNSNKETEINHCRLSIKNEIYQLQKKLQQKRKSILTINNKKDVNENNDYENNILNKFNNEMKDKYNNISESNNTFEKYSNKSLFLSNKDLFNYSLNNSQLFMNNSITINKENKSLFSKYNNTSSNKDNTFSFKKDITDYDKYDLYDFTKKKRYRSNGYYNPNIILGTFKYDIVLNPIECKNQDDDHSNLIYDLNDYNLNFEEIKDENFVKNDLNYHSNNNNDFFSQNAKFVKPKNILPSFKIGTSKGSFITHAKCAHNFTYNKINLDYEDLKNFHRPDFCKWMLEKKKRRSFSIVIGENCDLNDRTGNKSWICNLITKEHLNKKEKKMKMKNVQYMNAYEIFKDKKKLSLIEGKFALFEHIDEYPLLISNFGMASKLKKYLYSKKLFMSNNSMPNDLNEVESKTAKVLGPNGVQILIQPNQKLQLLAQIDLNQINGLAVIDNNMYKAPAFYEGNMKNIIYDNEGKKRYRFILTVKKSKKGIHSFSIREGEHIYTIAQEEPKIEVYPPQSRQYNMFLKNKIETYTYKIYNEIGYNAGINFKVFTKLFPAVTEQVLKKNFKDMNIEIDKNICYFTKIPNELNQMTITPENICQFESCQFGIFKLREIGINNLTNADKISYATNKFKQKTNDQKEHFLARIVESELLTTPWNLTQNFLQSKQTNGMLAIKGIGDPSNGYGGYSYLKMPVKSYSENRTLKEEMDVLKNQNKNIKTVTGTDADLRKLSKDEIRVKLIQLGISEDKIKSLGRWGRVALLRDRSSKAAELGYAGEITKYARNQRFNIKTQRDEYQRNINEVFKKQVDYITNSDEYTKYDENEDNDDNDNMNMDEGYYDSNFDENTISYEDKSKSMAFMRNMIFSNKKKKGLNSSSISNDKYNLFAVPENSVTSRNHNINDDNDSIIKLLNRSKKSELRPSTKIKLEIGNNDIDLLKKKTSRKNFDNIYEYDLEKSNINKRKRRDSPDKLFNEIIGDIIDLCSNKDIEKIFIQPVKKKDYPDYYFFVSNPIDLGTMKNKSKRAEYKTIEQFKNDLNLMVDNSITFNGETHNVTIKAKELRDIGIQKINLNFDELQKLENQIKSECIPNII